ncbi:unnamed protein product [Heterobilharzia americana]|nr:unnamed protein product [Heterobilharzia americana]
MNRSRMTISCVIIILMGCTLIIWNGYHYWSMLYTSIDDKQIIKKLQNTRYDFIIVGGGTAGSIIIRKIWDGFQKHRCCSLHKNNLCLSQMTCMRRVVYSNNNNLICQAICFDYQPKILLLESGPRISWSMKKISDIPLFAPLLYGRGIDEIDRTTSQRSAAFQMKDNVILIPRGHVLGGTALLNAMIFSYDFFTTLFGDRTEGCQLKPEMVSHLPYNELIHSYFSEAFNLQGQKVNSVPTYESVEGLNTPMVFVRNAQRISSYSECLLPLMNKNLEDLTVITDIHVEKCDVSVIDCSIFFPGILSQASALTSIGYYRTSYQKAENDSRPDIQYTIISASPFEKDTFESLGNFNPTAWHQFSKDENRANFENPIVLLVSLLNPLSRGEIKMKKNDNGSPNGKLEVNPAYLSEPNDVNRLVEGIIWIYKALNYVNAMNKLNLTISNTKKPISIKLHLPHYFGCPKIPKAESEKSFEQTNFSEELKEAIACLTKSTTLSNYHTVGTCAMKLQNTNYPAVVDQNFKLIGVNNVRIGDASVISKIPTGNPAALIMAIGNQLAKYVVRENWQQLIMTTNSK